MSFVAVAVIGAVGAAGTIGSAAIASSGANKAANTQAQGAEYAAQLQKQASDAALAEQQRQFNVNQGNIQPWLQTGMGGLANLAYLMGIPVGGGAPSTTSSVSPGIGQPANLPTRTADSMIGGGRGFLPMDTISASPQLLNSQSPTSPTRGQVDANAAAGRDAWGNVIAPQGGGAGIPLSSMVNPSLGDPGSLLKPWTEQFQAPTNVTEQNDPGYQFRLKEGQKLIQNSAAAKGNLLSGGTAKALDRYGQDYASNEYGNVYNRSLGQFQQRYNIDQANKADTFNRLSAISGTGQVAANQLSSLGTNSANNISNILMTSGTNQAQQANNAAAARASGYAAGGNIWGNAFGGITNNLSSLLMMNQMMKGGGGSSSVPSLPPYDSGFYAGMGG